LYGGSSAERRWIVRYIKIDVAKCKRPDGDLKYDGTIGERRDGDSGL
jgi:hypothetical protein